MQFMARLRGFVWLAAGVVFALLAGLVAYSTLTRVVETPTNSTAAGPMVTVVAASRAVPVRNVLTLDDLIEIELPADAVPEGAVRTTDAAVGRLTMEALYTGEALLEQRLVDPNVVSPDGRKALYLVDDQVLMAIPAQDILSRAGILQAGGHGDLYFSLPFPENRGVGASSGDDKEQQGTFSLLQNVTIAGLIGGVQPASSDEESTGDKPAVPLQPTAVLLSIPPQDALALKYAIDAGGTLDMVLRAPGVERPYETDPVDVDYLINRYSIPTGPGR
jgi:pilus assembly protein CpaB